MRRRPLDYADLIWLVAETDEIGDGEAEVHRVGTSEKGKTKGKPGVGRYVFACLPTYILTGFLRVWKEVVQSDDM